MSARRTSPSADDATSRAVAHERIEDRRAACGVLGPFASEPDYVAARDAEFFSRVPGIFADHREPASRVDHQTPLALAQVGVRRNLLGNPSACEGLHHDPIGPL